MGDHPLKVEHSLLNLLRFFAALWVLVFHAQIHFGALPGLSFMQPIIGQGVIAMTLFFMLSGFVLSMRYREFTEDSAFVNFFAARLARLYPVYLFMGLVTVWSIPLSFEFFFLPSMGDSAQLLWSVLVIVIFILALQAWFPSLFSVWNFNGSWSLSVEAFFYALFPFLRTRLTAASNSTLLLLFLLFPVVCATIVAGLVVNAKEGADTSIVFYVVPIYRLPEFVFGCLVYVFAVERNLWSRRMSLLALALGGLGIILIYARNIPGNLDYGFLFMPVFALAFIWSLGRVLPELFERAANYAGHISYCVYIVQFGTIPIFKKVLDGQDVGLKWAVFIAVNCIFAILVYHIVEKTAYAHARALAKSTLANAIVCVRRASR